MSTHSKREGLIRQVRRAYHLLENAQDYYRVVGSEYRQRLPDMERKFILLWQSLEEHKQAIDVIIEEM